MLDLKGVILIDKRHATSTCTPSANHKLLLLQTQPVACLLEDSLMHYMRLLAHANTIYK